MAIRLTQDALEYLTKELAKFRLTQDAIEYITKENAKLRLTQDNLEAITKELAKYRLTQDALEVITRETVKVRITQFALEVISVTVPNWLLDTVCGESWVQKVLNSQLTIDTHCGIFWPNEVWTVSEEDDVLWPLTGIAFWQIISLCGIGWKVSPPVSLLIAQADNDYFFPSLPITREKCITGPGVPATGGVNVPFMWTSNDI